MKRFGVVAVYVVAFVLAGMSIAAALGVLTPGSYASSQDIYKARVASDGSIVKGSVGTSSQRFSTGTYAVTFANDVSGCIYAGILSAKKSITTPIDGGGITVTPRYSDSKQVLVHTFSNGDTRADHGFDLVVFCNSPSSPSP